jgi:hypothetical protein
VRSGSCELGGVVERWTWDGRTYAATRHVGEQLVARLVLTVHDEVRLHAEASGWVLRAGTVGPDVLWRRGDDEHEAVADGLTGPSPAFDAVLGSRFELAVGASRRVRLLMVTEPVLATRLVDEQWTRARERGYEVADLATGERRLVDLDTPVTGFMAS